jgi:hypothetical protein
MAPCEVRHLFDEGFADRLSAWDVRFAAREFLSLDGTSWHWNKTDDGTQPAITVKADDELEAIEKAEWNSDSTSRS